MADVRIVLGRFSASAIGETDKGKAWLRTMDRTENIPFDAVDDYEQLASIAGLSVDIQGRR